MVGGGGNIARGAVKQDIASPRLARGVKQDIASPRLARL